MIACLRGRVLSHEAGTVVLDVGGVGYLLSVTSSALRRAAAAGGSDLRLETYLHVREDALQLFGFSQVAERELFELLLGVSGIGPKAALAIVSGYEPDQIRRAVAHGDHALFTSIPGIGRKTAERVVLDLKDRVGAVSPVAPGATASEPDEHLLAREALVALGMSVADAEIALREVGADLAVPERVRAALAARAGAVVA
ncbi:MAG TPA: Holliday junction branch migration protein RuvA [Gaiellales bacterium]|nr:Holliday junction branch migration protein RuvA [Gaiellales bacterium]